MIVTIEKRRVNTSVAEGAMDGYGLYARFDGAGTLPFQDNPVWVADFRCLTDAEAFKSLLEKEYPK